MHAHTLNLRAWLCCGCNIINGPENEAVLYTSSLHDESLHHLGLQYQKAYISINYTITNFIVLEKECKNAY